MRKTTADIPLWAACALGWLGCSPEFTSNRVETTGGTGSVVAAAGSSVWQGMGASVTLGGSGSDAAAGGAGTAGSGGGGTAGSGVETGASGGMNASGGARGDSSVPASGGAWSGLDAGASADASLPCPPQEVGCEHVTVPQPLAHWRFDGNLSDSSGNGHDAEEVGTVTYAVTPTETGAIFTEGWGRNYSFATVFRSTFDSFTLSVRLRIDAYDRAMPVFGLSAPGLDSLSTNKWLLHLCAQDYCAGVSPGVVVETEVTDAGNNSYATLGPLPPVGAWVHLGLVVNANQVAYYVDGALISSSFYTPAETLATVIHLGGITSTTTSVHGVIDDIRVYDEVLDAAQVAALFAGF